ncbi:uncharacterized protein Dana_GF14452 [Drosophila ananassae]|uniref:procollagen-proline 4-dioxygenase n=1 Tax=Drosophila ananassae TaxID=7217 RepID=B3MKU8_DROAN|nr:prolyl 4-hydroxylase subunit alpha-1 [Drosophila ananassae]EDV31629.2 uncharacterized protein Dana_GF14452 [Drosophila ananassae]
MLMKEVLFKIIHLIFIFYSVSGEEQDEGERENELTYTTSIRALAELRDIENSYMKHLSNYVNSLQKKVKFLKKYLESLTRENIDSEKYVKNPLNIFGLVRRSHEDWPKINAYIRSNDSFKDDLNEMHNYFNRTPNSQDMEEALWGMHRIESIYDLQAWDMANGVISTHKLPSQMSATDCLAVANFMYNQSEFRRAAQWYRIALHFIQKEKNGMAAEFYGPKREDLKKMFVISRLQEGSIDDLPSYLDELSQKPDIPLTYLKPKPLPTPLQIGCRGEYPNQSRLVCRYNTTTTPFMRIAPLKEEEISKDPLIWLYHDVLFDSEMALLTKNLTREEMIQGYTNNQTTPDKGYRIFQVKVYEGDGGKLDRTLVNRMTDISGLDVGNHTYLARANYGLGTHFQEHSDYVDLRENPDLGSEGDRLFTFLFYASDVEMGGATIFPAANISIKPKKGSALFWYNLHNDWEPNPLSRHAVCPMVLGNRWILNKSMLSHRQIFLKLCYK